MCQRARVGTEQALRRLWRPDRNARRVDQPLGAQPAPDTIALAQRRVKAFALQVHHLLRGMQFDRDVGVPFVPVADARQQPALGERRQHAHAHAQVGAGGGSRRRSHAVVDLIQRRAHRTQQRRAGRVQHDALGASIEELKAEL